MADATNENALTARFSDAVVVAAPQQPTNIASTSSALAVASASGVAVDASESNTTGDDERAKVRAQCVAMFRTGASYREVAEHLQLTTGTVQSHIKQARRMGELGDEAPARAKGRPRLINDAVDAMLVRIIQEKGTRSARLIQEELAKPPHNTTLSYEVVRRRVKQLIDSIAALPPHQHQAGDDQEEEEQEEGSGGLRGYEQVARDLDMLAETVRSIVTNVTQTLDGDDQDGSEENAGDENSGADANDDNAFEASDDANGNKERESPKRLIDATSNETASTASVDASAALTMAAVRGGSSEAAQLQQSALTSNLHQSASSDGVPHTFSGDAIADTEQVAGGEPRRRSGRPRTMTAGMDETITNELRADPTVTTRAIHVKLLAQFQDLDVSFETVRRRVQEIRAQNCLGSDAGAAGQATTSSGAVETKPNHPASVGATESAVSANPSSISSPDPQTPSSARKAKKGEYSPHTRALCVEKHEVDGMSYANIAKELGIPQDSVRAIIRKAKRTGSVQSAPRSGRPRKTSEIVDRVILQAVRANERSSAKAIQESLLKVFNVKVSSETIRRRVLANTRQRLLAISSGGDPSASNPELRPLNEDATAAAVVSARANEEQAASTTGTPAQDQQAPADDINNAPEPTSANALMETSARQSEPAPAWHELPPSTSPTTRATGQKRHLDEPTFAVVPAEPPVPTKGTQRSASPSTVPTDQHEQNQPQQPKKKRAKRREYSVELREKCVAMHEQGEGYRRIGQALDMPHTTVRAIVEKVTRTGSVLPAPRSGRPRKTDEIVDRVILEAVRNNEKCSARMIQDELLRGYGVRISCETIRRRVKDHSRQSLARGETLLPTIASETQPGVAISSRAQQTSLEAANQVVGAAASGSTSAQRPVQVSISSLPTFPTQQQQQQHQQPMQEEQMLQLLPMQVVSDDSTSIVL